MQVDVGVRIFGGICQFGAVIEKSRQDAGATKDLHDCGAADLEARFSDCSNVPLRQLAGNFGLWSSLNAVGCAHVCEEGFAGVR
jgi:hypothetical protein